MSVATEISKLQTNLMNAYSTVEEKGATLPANQNFDNLATAISSIPSGGSTGKYQLLQRISDDNGTGIGTVSGFFTDANNVEYAVVCLDAVYRGTGKFLSTINTVTNLPIYTQSDVWESKETSTFNTQKIVDYCLSTSYTSSSCEICRNNSFIIDGVTYYGQLPNIIELIDILEKRTDINNLDISDGTHINVDVVTCSSNQGNGLFCWSIQKGAVENSYGKSFDYFVIPVLEIPNT